MDNIDKKISQVGVREVKPNLYAWLDIISLNEKKNYDMTDDNTMVNCYR